MQNIPEINNVFDLPDEGQAILRYVGSIHGKNGVFCGIELLGDIKSKGKNSGLVNGVQYFNVEIPNSGLFIPLRKFQGWFNNSKPEINTNDFEVQRIVDLYQNRILKSEQDLKEMSSQLDELDTDLKMKEELWIKKEENFERYKSQKNLEIEQLMTTINVLQQKVQESEEKFNQLSATGGGGNNNNNNNNKDDVDVDVDRLQSQLETEKQRFNQFKIEKNREIDELRQIEIKNFKLEMELEKLKTDSVTEGAKSNELNQFKIQNEQLQLQNTQLKNQLDKLKSQLNFNTNNEGIIINETNEQINKWIDESGALKIYQPTTVIDPTGGNPNFCKYCDREGHSTIECPYENDNMDQF